MKKEKLCNLTELLGRLMMSGLFIIAGIGKIAQYTETQAYMNSTGVPGMLLPVTIFLEVVGGLCIAVGFQTRAVSLLLAGFSVITALIFHSRFADQIQMVMFLKNVAISGGFLILFTNGPGKFSVDEWKKKS